ncbi:MAG: gamma-glutamylcyclotransferase family protein [Polyangiales bacterium]
MLIFVYGTLRRGEPNHRQLMGTRARYVGSVWTAPCYELVDLGPYPALLEGGDTSVKGELYEVDDLGLVRLDAFEDVPDLYDRKAVTIPGAPAYAYFMRKELAAHAPRIEQGDWCRRGDETVELPDRNDHFGDVMASAEQAG